MLLKKIFWFWWREKKNLFQSFCHIKNSGQIERHDALSFRSYSMSYTPPSHHALCLRTPLLVVHYVVHLSFRLCTMSSTSLSGCALCRPPLFQVVHYVFHLSFRLCTMSSTSLSGCALCRPPLRWTTECTTWKRGGRHSAQLEVEFEDIVHDVKGVCKTCYMTGRRVHHVFQSGHYFL
jgi:hypothetical protein